MPKRTQGENINQLAEVVAQGLMHLKSMVALMVEGSEPIQDHIQQLIDIANQSTDSRSPKFDFGLAPTEEAT